MMLRPTKIVCPSQTESMGHQSLVMDIATLFLQSCLQLTADGLEVLASGNPLSMNNVDAIARQHHVTDRDLDTIPQIGKVLPPPMVLDFDGLESLANELEDRADEQGAYRRRYEQFAPGIIDQKLVEIHGHLDRFVESLVSQADFCTAIEVLEAMQRRWRTAIDSSESRLWEPRFSEALRQSVTSIRRYDANANSRPWYRRLFGDRLGKEVRQKLEQQFVKDHQIANRRSEQLQAEIRLEVKRRLLSEDDESSIPGRVRKLAAQTQQLHQIAKALRAEVVPLTDTVTVTQLVHHVNHPLDGGITLHQLIEGACAANDCGTDDVAKRLRRGLPVNGSVMTAANLAELPERIAVSVLKKFADVFFDEAIEAVLQIDLTSPEVQLQLAKVLPAACDKAQPYIRFLPTRNGYKVREFYVHAHPEVRMLMESYRNGTTRFSNPRHDKDFEIPEKHVLVLVTNVLGPGHAKLDFQRACYARSRMLGKKTFTSIHPFQQRLSRPLALVDRPSDRSDSVAVFDLALEFGIITQTKFGTNVVYTLSDMDDTVAYCFEKGIVRRKIEDADHFIRLLEANWFADVVNANVNDLPPKWHSRLLARLDCDSSANIARDMVSLKILEGGKNRYRFSVRHNVKQPLHADLHLVETMMTPGLTKAVFIKKLYTVDELYIRVLDDLIDAQARELIPYRRLTPFGKQQVDIRSRREV